MEAYLEQSLFVWTARTFSEDQCIGVYTTMRAFLDRYPDLPELGYSWPDILILANRAATTPSPS